MTGKQTILMMTAVFCLGGCSIVDQQLIDRPKLEYTGVKLDHKSPLEAVPVFQFKVANTNPISLKVSKISYNLDLNYRKKFVKGVSGQNIRIASIGYRNLELPVAFDFMDVLDPSDFFTHAEPVAYNLQGAISVGPYSLPFQASGTFETPQLLKARLKTLSVSKLSPLSASLLCTLEIENPNAFVFETASLEYELTLNQIRLIGGGITDIGRVEPSGKLDIHLPARPVFSGTEDPLYSALQLPITPYVLTGRMKIQGPGIGTRQFPFSESGEIILQK